MSCLFCGIVAGEIPATIVFQDDQVVAFRDVDPQAPTHVLIVPREHVATVHERGAQHATVLAAMVGAARRVGGDASYRLVFNHGADAGQSVPHVHMHLLAGRKLGWPPG